ncbi:hypothetical protein RA210_U140082 [Rubrivivax sp. A210]|nr:hypothetical protein RA210_U140082 [Rubrivivax sp. A210]
MPDLAGLFRSHAVDGNAAGRAPVLVRLVVVDEVALVEQADCCLVQCHRLGHHRGNTRTFALQDFVAFVVAAIRQRDELVFRGSCLGKLGHVRQLMAVMADIGDLMGHHQVVLGIDHGLHVVADDDRSRRKCWNYDSVGAKEFPHGLGRQEKFKAASGLPESCPPRHPPSEAPGKRGARLASSAPQILAWPFIPSRTPPA